jgi:hypothetical protein
MSDFRLWTGEGRKRRKQKGGQMRNTMKHRPNIDVKLVLDYIGG